MKIPPAVRQSLLEALKALLYAAVGMITATSAGCILAPVL